MGFDPGQGHATKIHNADRAVKAGAQHFAATVGGIAASGEDPFKTQLAGEAIEAAMRSALAKMAALGRAMPRGVTSDDEGAMATERRLIGSLAGFELAHVWALED